VKKDRLSGRGRLGKKLQGAIRQRAACPPRDTELSHFAARGQGHHLKKKQEHLQIAFFQLHFDGP
jgi:hypothetical protein